MTLVDDRELPNPVGFVSYTQDGTADLSGRFKTPSQKVVVPLTFILSRMLLRGYYTYRLIKPTALALSVLLAAGGYDRALISRESTEAAIAGKPFMRHSILGLRELPFESTYAIRFVDNGGPCAVIVASKVIVDAHTTQVSIADPMQSEDILPVIFRNNVVKSIGQCPEPQLPSWRDTIRSQEFRR